MIGIVGKKCGMTRVFTDDGRSVPVTIVQADPNFINKIKTKDIDGYNAIQVSAGSKVKHLSKPNQGQINQKNKELRSNLHEFRLNDHEVDMVEAGKEIKVNYFKKGEKVDVSGKSIGKGYAGVIKRHNFSMQDATHGNSLSHRALGSTGQCQTPGRVFKGKKMAGQMGNVQVTEECLEILRVDNERNLLLVKGAIPGSKNGFVRVFLSNKKSSVNEQISKQLSESKAAEVIETKVVETEAVENEVVETESDENEVVETEAVENEVVETEAVENEVVETKNEETEDK